MVTILAVAQAETRPHRCQAHPTRPKQEIQKIENKARKRAPKGRYGHGWGYAWPMDRRILYNRASAAPDGKPWSERKALVWWDESKREWTGHDVADFTRGVGHPNHQKHTAVN